MNSSANPYLRLISNNRNFRLAFSALAVSLAGDWFHLMAVLVVLDQLGWNQATVVGAVFVLKQLPLFLLAPFAGTLADRMSRRRIMIISDLARVASALTFLLLPYFPSVALVLGLVFLHACFSAFFEPARSAFIPDIVQKEDLLTANAMGSIVWSSMLVVGAALGGILTEFLGWRVAIIFDSVTFLISAHLITKIDYHGVRAPQSEGEVRQKALPEFLRYLNQNPKVKAAACIKCLAGVAGGVYSLLPILGQEVFRLGHSGSLGATVLLVARGSGALVGPFFVRSIMEAGNSYSMVKAIGVAISGLGIFYICVGLSPTLAFAALFVFLAHMAGAVIWVWSTLLVQLETKADMRGRVSGMELGLWTLTYSSSNMAAGLIVDWKLLSISGAISAIAALSLFAALIWMKWQRLWEAEGRSGRSGE